MLAHYSMSVKDVRVNTVASQEHSEEYKQSRGMPEKVSVIQSNLLELVVRLVNIVSETDILKFSFLYFDFFQV